MKNKMNKTNRFNSEKIENEEKNAFSQFFHSCGIYIQKNYAFLILFFVGLFTVSAINFMKITTVQTVANFSISDFEIGQISDRTIIADRSLSPDKLDPVGITKGEKIIKKGFPITEESYAKLKKMATSPLYIDYRAFANSELFIFLLAIMWYLLFSFVDFGRKVLFKECLLHVILFAIVYFVTAFGGKLSLFSSAYSICIIIPTSICIMLVTILYGNLSAVLLSFIISLGVLNASGWQIPTCLFTLASALSSTVIVRKIERRIDLVVAGIIMALFEVVFILLLQVIFNEAISGIAPLLFGVAINGFISGILTLGLLTPLETILNTASVFRLMDLSDNNTPIFKQMQIQANGTYNHSMMVAQLAESACREINANPILARVGGYYHDIGKIEQSEYFVENQLNMQNKHNDINPTLSASVIKSHVRKGIEKGHQLHLPQAVIDIIAEHHGNSIITYFYNEATKKDATLSPEDFAYPGNPPSSKESGVVMLADIVEAACHTLDNPTSGRLEKFISNLISQKIEHGQLDNCELTFSDIAKIKNSFVNLLTGYYHNRIKYQNQQDPDSQSQTKKENNGDEKND
ncbi:MAG: HDIG domain-containing protein [Treponema sp.]|nr:HDIG domain-containing protein [Spirochaetales bacterium]MDY6191331.1 HDIG domain-containing protein [Treponema sp.]